LHGRLSLGGGTGHCALSKGLSALEGAGIFSANSFCRFFKVISFFLIFTAAAAELLGGEVEDDKIVQLLGQL
jgi:hypothetical protein